MAYWEYDELTDEQQAAEDTLWTELDAIDAQLTEAYDASVAAQATFAENH
jgi:hypothetical protein